MTMRTPQWWIVWCYAAPCSHLKRSIMQRFSPVELGESKLILEKENRKHTNLKRENPQIWAEIFARFSSRFSQPLTKFYPCVMPFYSDHLVSWIVILVRACPYHWDSFFSWGVVQFHRSCCLNNAPQWIKKSVSGESILWILLLREVSTGHLSSGTKNHVTCSRL